MPSLVIFQENIFMSGSSRVEALLSPSIGTRCRVEIGNSEWAHFESCSCVLSYAFLHGIEAHMADAFKRFLTLTGHSNWSFMSGLLLE